MCERAPKLTAPPPPLSQAVVDALKQTHKDCSITLQTVPNGWHCLMDVDLAFLSSIIALSIGPVGNKSMAQPEIEDDGRHDWVPDSSQVESCNLEYVRKMKTRQEEERARKKKEAHEREKARRDAAARPNLTPDGFRIESESARHERALHTALQDGNTSSDSEPEPTFERAMSAEDWIERRIAGRADDSSTIAAGKPRARRVLGEGALAGGGPTPSASGQ